MTGNHSTSDPCATARRWLEASHALVITAGAGMGIDAGLPDFRGPEGLWRVFPALKERGMQLMDIATPHWFAEDPALAWGFYGQRLLSYQAAQPHKGHDTLRRWSADRPHWVVTSNVDGLLHKAGWPQECTWELHGSIHDWQCSTPCCTTCWPADIAALELDPASGLARRWPRCPHCGACARPHLMMFGDWSWLALGIMEAEQACRAFLKRHGGDGLVVIECGAGTDLPSIRDLGEWMLLKHGARLIRINPDEDAETPGHERLCSIPLSAAEALTRIGYPNSVRHSQSETDAPL